MGDLEQELTERRDTYCRRADTARIRLRLAQEEYTAVMDAIIRLNSALVALRSAADLERVPAGIAPWANLPNPSA